MSEKSDQIKSLLIHPGWKQVEEYILSSQALKFNEIAAKDASSENILKSVGAIDSLKKLIGWVYSSAAAKQDSEV